MDGKRKKGKEEKEKTEENINNMGGPTVQGGQHLPRTFPARMATVLCCAVDGMVPETKVKGTYSWAGEGRGA